MNLVIIRTRVCFSVNMAIYVILRNNILLTMLDLLSPQFTQIIVHPKLQACSISKAGHCHPDFPPFEGKIIIRYIL